jgi:hypothetical protein
MEKPCPRFEFLWERIEEADFNWRCVYSLVIPLGEFDIRRTDAKNNPTEMKLEIGKTRTRIGRGFPVCNGEVETPFRDGVHAQWDCDALGGHIPIVAVCGDEWRLVVKQPKET